MKFNENLSAIHAYLCADGYVIRNPEGKSKYYYIGFRNMCNELLVDFEMRFFSEFGVKPRRCKDGRTVVQRKELYFIFTKDYSYYSREWILPKLSKKNLAFWLRAFFDCEGWVHNRNAVDRHIGLDSVNYKGILQIKKALEKFGINSKFKKKENIYRLLIYGKENLINYEKKIGFLHPKKKNILGQAIESYVDYNWKFNSKKDVLDFLRDRIKCQKRIRICSKYRKNVELLSKLLFDYLDVKSKIYGPCYNGNGTKFYELCVSRKGDGGRMKNLLLNY